MGFNNENQGAIWIRTAKTSGLEYKSGTINVEGKEFKITMFDNQYKKHDQQPDYNIVIEPLIEKEIPTANFMKPPEKSWKEKEADKGISEISIEEIPF